MAQLPTEIWHLIAWYLPKSQVLQLKSLNSVFFDCAMDIDWGQVVVDTIDPIRAARVLSRMADPFVTSRTRKLTLHLRWPCAFTFISPVLVATMATHLLNVLPLLHHVSFLEMKLLSVPLDFLPALFRTITSSPLAKTIEKLSLSGYLDTFASLLKYPNPFANLSALEINLVDRDNDELPKHTVNTNDILGLARFILSLSPSLQLLRLWSLLDISLLFSRLSHPLHDSSSLIPLPNLKSFFLILPVNMSIRSSPQSIHHFLLVHSTNIQHLQLRMRLSGSWAGDEDESAFEIWFFNFVNDFAHDSTTKPNSHSFRNLQTLDINPPTTPAGLSATLAFIKQTAPTLSSFMIRRCDLGIEGAYQVVDALMAGQVGSSKLKSLRMDVNFLSAPFIKLLAFKLPQLQNLRLFVKYFSNFWQTWFIHSIGRRRYVEDECFASWKLRSLCIRQSYARADDVVAVVAAVVPSIILGEDDESPDKWC